MARAAAEEGARMFKNEENISERLLWKIMNEWEATLYL